MKNLVEKEYWDSIYKNIGAGDNQTSSWQGLKNSIKNLTRDYSNFIIWEVLLPKYLPRNNQYKILEVGCAPGKYLMKFNSEYGYVPYGVEYSEKGVAITRENFKNAGLPEENIVQADFFSEGFQSDYAGKFDVVFSRGFIEHYDNVEKVVSDHYRLLNRGGLLVIMIPNLSGVNYHLAKILNIDSFRLHNISIMNKKSFASLFSKLSLEQLYSDYVGIFSWGLFNTNKRWKYVLHRVLLLIQRPVDLFLRVIFPGGMRYKYTSPYLLFIGKKR